MGELLERRYTAHRRDWSPSTAHDHHNTIDRWITPHVGRWRVTAVKAAVLERFYRDLGLHGGRKRAPLSGTSVRKAHSLVHAALEDAVRWELIVVNPASRARRPKVVKHEATVPPIDQIYAAVAAADPAMAALIRVAIATGARRDELVGLQWGDVDLDAGTVHMRRAIVVIGAARSR